jgi:Ca-activated chloride channel family protein
LLENRWKYFRATSNNKLAEIYGEINKLETTEIEELKFYDYDENTYHSYGCGILLLVEIGLRNTFIKALFSS